MKKLKLIIKTNLLIYARIGSEKRPVIYDLVENLIGREIKIPLDFIAYFLLIFFFQIALLGSIAEVYAQESISTYFILSGLLLLLTMSLLEIFIYYNHLQVNPLLLKILPLSNRTFISCIVIDHFVGLRLASFLIFIILFPIIGVTYNKSFTLSHYLYPCIMYINLFSVISFSFLLLKNSFRSIFNRGELKLSLPLQWFFILSFIIILYSMSSDRISINLIESLLVFSKKYLIPFSIFSLLLWPFMIIYFLNTKRISGS